MTLQVSNKILTGFCVLIFIAVVSFSGPRSVYADEERLLLNGVIMEINNPSRQVVVDVKTLGCIGTKTFTLDDMSSLRAKKGEKIDFYIDSDHCPSSRGSKMLWPRRMK